MSLRVNKKVDDRNDRFLELIESNLNFLRKGLNQGD